MKVQRQSKILELIDQYAIETQEELSDKLRACGFEVTQATVSRDIKELRLVKILSEKGGYRYALSVPETVAGIANKFRIIFHESVTKVDNAMNFVCIRTLPGMAHAAAAAVDAMNWNGVVGTLAGDDTIFIMMKSEEKATEICAEFNRMLQ